MPAGCDFTCKNDKCEQHKNGFTITSPWPMGRIELIINSTKIKENKEFRDYLIAQKNNGEKLACIQLPDDDKIPVIAYKVSLWDDNKKCINSYPIMESNIDNLEEAIKNADFTKSSISDILRDFNDLIANGIICPFCKEKLTQNRWFTNGK